MTQVEDPGFYSRSSPNFKHIINLKILVLEVQDSNKLPGDAHMAGFQTSLTSKISTEPGQPEFKPRHTVFLHSQDSKQSGGQQLPTNFVFTNLLTFVGVY